MAADREVRALETDPGAEPPWNPGEDFAVSESQDDTILHEVVAENPDDDLLRLVVDTIHTMRRFGGVVQIAPVREHIAGDMYRTVEFVARWNPYMPPVKRADENGAAEPVSVSDIPSRSVAEEA